MPLTLLWWLTGTRRESKEALTDIKNRWFVAPSNWWMKTSAQVYGTFIIYLPFPTLAPIAEGFHQNWCLLACNLSFNSLTFNVVNDQEKGPRRRSFASSIVKRGDFVVVGLGVEWPFGKCEECCKGVCVLIFVWTCGWDVGKEWKFGLKCF